MQSMEQWGVMLILRDQERDTHRDWGQADMGAWGTPLPGLEVVPHRPGRKQACEKHKGTGTPGVFSREVFLPICFRIVPKKVLYHPLPLGGKTLSGQAPVIGWYTGVSPKWLEVQKTGHHSLS